MLADGDGGVELSRETFADCLARCEAAQLEAFELTLALAAEVVSAACRAGDGWLGAVRAGLLALLAFLDEEPVLARHLVVGSALAGPAVLARRAEVLDRVAMLLDDERAPARAYPPPLTARAVTSGVLGVLHARLSEREPGPLVELAGPLMSFTTTPFLGARAARRELTLGGGRLSASAPGAELDTTHAPGRRSIHRREIEALSVIAGEPGLNNAQVGLRAGIEDPAHVSRLLTRLARLGLIEDKRAPALRSGARAWRLTGSGEELRTRARDARAPRAIPNLPEEFAGRLDHRAVCALRVIGDRPWLTSREVAARAAVDPARISRLLELLAELGLVESVREAHRKGAPKAWLITDRGRRLDQGIGRQTPAPARSAALDLMWRSGGRLSEPAVRALRAIAAQPGLSNSEIAQRARIADANSISQLLARLARRGLIENARKRGRRNAWTLTAAGAELEQAIRREASAKVPRSVAFDVLRGRGGRMNHRVASVLSAIGAEPGLSNAEIAERVGVESKAHASSLLSRLASFGLIENQAPDRAPFKANAWRLTASGRNLEIAIRHSGQSTTPRTSRGGHGANPTAARR